MAEGIVYLAVVLFPFLIFLVNLICACFTASTGSNQKLSEFVPKLRRFDLKDLQRFINFHNAYKTSS